MNEKLRKAQFIANELLQVCKKVNDRVISTEYAITEFNTEYCIVTYSNRYIKKINITCDSLRAIVIDVMREIG